MSNVGNSERSRDPSPRRLAGECGCGALSYTVADEFEYGGICHCSGCRRATGSAFKPYLGIRRDQLELVRGADRTMTFGGESGYDVRCRDCGSLMYSVVRDGEYVHVAMGSLVEEPTLRPNHHMFVGSKAGWDEIVDDLPQFLEYPQ